MFVKRKIFFVIISFSILSILEGCSGGGKLLTTPTATPQSQTPTPPPSGSPTESINYGQSAYAFTVGQPATTQAPSTTGGSPTQYSIQQSLPAGLTFNTSNGVISGKPSAESAGTSIVVSAGNPRNGINLVSTSILISASPYSPPP